MIHMNWPHVGFGNSEDTIWFNWFMHFQGLLWNSFFWSLNKINMLGLFSAPSLPPSWFGWKFQTVFRRLRSNATYDSIWFHTVISFMESYGNILLLTWIFMEPWHNLCNLFLGITAKWNDNLIKWSQKRNRLHSIRFWCLLKLILIIQRFFKWLKACYEANTLKFLLQPLQFRQFNFDLGRRL